MKYLLSVIAILWGINVYAQLSPAPQGLDNYKCIDTTRFEIHYSFKFKNHSSQKQYNEDRRVIQVGRSVIKDYSEIIYQCEYLQLIIPQYFISNKSGIWSLSLIVHSKG